MVVVGFAPEREAKAPGHVHGLGERDGRVVDNIEADAEQMRGMRDTAHGGVVKRRAKAARETAAEHGGEELRLPVCRAAIHSGP